MIDLTQSPASQGFRMPAEWAPHAATWLAWPHKEASWPGKLERIPPVFSAMVRALAPGEAVRICVADAAMEAAAGALLAGVDAMEFFHVANNDAWIRDHGPIFVNDGDGAQAIVDWGYNAWGDKYPPYDLDDTVPARIGAKLGIPVFHSDMILEGGSIDSDGEGTLLTTEACLLNRNRNPQLSRGEIESRLRDYLGVDTIVWLGEGIAGDDTDGHVDDLTRFVAPGVVVTAVEENVSDPNAAPLAANLQRLRAVRDAQQHRLEIFTLPMPAPVEWEGQRLPASYANFYIGNCVVLLPQFACAHDEVAHRVLETLFPQREIIGIDCRDLVWGLGAFHCLTQQHPSPGYRAQPSPRGNHLT
ncbi:MAG: agmatine deiminase family protein [Terriglobales bacterium]